MKSLATAMFSMLAVISLLTNAGNIAAQENDSPRPAETSAQEAGKAIQTSAKQVLTASPETDIPSAEAERPVKRTAPVLLDSIDPNKVYELTFDDLAFEMEKGADFSRDMLTPEINQYDGATIKLRGFIKPAFKQTGLNKFVFVRDNQECCFGPTAALYDNVLVRLGDGLKTNFTVRPVTVEGKLFLKEYQGIDGNTWSIYQMKDGKVK